MWALYLEITNSANGEEIPATVGIKKLKGCLKAFPLLHDANSEIQRVMQGSLLNKFTDENASLAGYSDRWPHRNVLRIGQIRQRR